jgi:hypothetical protein
MRILLACPVSDFKEYVIFDWINHVKKFAVDILLVDNSPNIQFSRRLQKEGIKVIYRKPRNNETMQENITSCMNLIKKYCDVHNYDYLFSVECDVFPPLDALTRLYAHNLPLVSGLYNISQSEGRALMLQQLIEVQPGEFHVVNVDVIEGFNFVDGTVKKIFGAGFGCLLINLKYFKNYFFHVDKNLSVHHDTFFYSDIAKIGLQHHVDTSILCEHKNSSWKIINKKFNARKRG